MTDVEDWAFSATQVSTYELCPRKWAFRYIDGVKAPPNKFAELGIETHGRLEGWLHNSVVPEGDGKDAKLARALIPLLPPPQAVDKDNVEIDQYFTYGGFKFILKVDLFMSRWYEGRPCVFDHKTGSNPDFWLTPEQMLEDIQATLYAAWGLTRTNAPAVDLQWNYVRTKGSALTKPVFATVNGRMISPRLGKTLESVKQMRDIMNSGVKALQVIHDVNGCGAYGGCPYKDKECNLTSADRMKSIMTQANQPPVQPQTTAFLGQLAGQPPAPPVAQPPMGAPQAQPPMAPPQVQPPLGAPQAPPQAQLPLPPPQAPYAAPQPPPQPLPQPPPPPQPQVNPPAAPPPPGPQYAPPPQYAQPAPPTPPPQYAQPPVPSAAPEAPEKPKGRGRPKATTANDPWVVFAAHALSRAPSTADAAAMADQMMDELHKRKG